MALRFLVGLSPAMLQRGYLVDRSAVDLAARRGPSTGMACQLCAGIAATEALKILLGRGKVLAAPRGMQFDAYRGKAAQTWRPWGNRNPVQRFALVIARRQLAADDARAIRPRDRKPTRLLERSWISLAGRRAATTPNPGASRSGTRRISSSMASIPATTASTTSTARPARSRSGRCSRRSRSRHGRGLSSLCAAAPGQSGYPAGVRREAAGRSNRSGGPACRVRRTAECPKTGA